MALRHLTNNRASVTPFLTIIAAGLVGVFILTYSHYVDLAYQGEQKRLLEIASDDILAGFDTSLLKNYGFLAYEATDAEQVAVTSLLSNLGANGHSTQNVFPEYESCETLLDGQRLAEESLKIASYHLSKEVIKEVSEIYRLSDRVQDKVKGYEKAQAFAQGLQTIQADIEDYYQVVKEVNGLYDCDKEWFEDVSSERATYKLALLERDYNLCIRRLRNVKKQLNSVDQHYEALKKEAFNETFSNVVSAMGFDKSDYLALFSEDGRASIDDVIGALKENERLVGQIIEEGDYDLIENLNVDIFFKEGPKRDPGWLRILNSEESKLERQGFYLSGFLGPWQVEPSLEIGYVDLGFDQTLLFNEYVLGTFKSKIEPSVRNFNFLTREERESAYANGEVEYIIVGREGSDHHIKLRIFAIRTACNLAHLASDREKLDVAKTIGAAIGSWFPGGSAVGTLLVLITWSGIESYYDVGSLCKGQGIPFVKTDQSWTTDIDLAQKKVIKNDPPIQGSETIADQYYMTYYNDYLRLMLMVVHNEQKVQRMLRVIEKNESQAQGKPFELGNKVFSHQLKWRGFTTVGGYYDQMHPE